MGSDEKSRRELAQFLRSRRDRITPEEAGFPVGMRRRTPGLRREEVAVLAGLSPTWYAYLEQGRAINPSSQVLDSLSNVLGLSDDERTYIYILALGRSAAEDSVRPGRSTSPGNALMWQIIEEFGQGAYPVYIGNRYTDVVAWNRAAAEWYTDFGALPEDRRNLLTWLFTDPQAAARIVDLDAEKHTIVARLRHLYAANPDDAGMNRVVARLERESVEFRRLWHGHTVERQRPWIRKVRPPSQDVQTVHIVTLRLVHDDAYSIQLHLPAAPPG